MSSMCFHATQKTLLIHTWLILNKWGNKSNYICFMFVSSSGSTSIMLLLAPTVFAMACWVLWPVTIIVLLHWSEIFWICMCERKHLDPGYNPSDSLLPYVNRLRVWMQSFCIRVRSTHQMCWFVVWKLSNLNKRVQKKRSDVYAMTMRDLLNPRK